MPNMPTALAAYAGWQFLTKNADKAKEWTDWFKNLHDAPDEIQELNEKTTQARETITQIEELIKSRPDLLDGASGEKLKEKIDASIKSTDAALGKMNKMLADLSTKGAEEGHGNVARGLEKYWNSYRYRDEWQDKVKAADNDLQKELSSLGALMSGVYSCVFLCCKNVYLILIRLTGKPCLSLSQHRPLQGPLVLLSTLLQRPLLLLLPPLLELADKRRSLLRFQLAPPLL